MGKRMDRPVSARHIMLYEDDWNFFTQFYGKDSANPIGQSTAIRTIISKWVQGMRQRMADKEDQARGRAQLSHLNDVLPEASPGPSSHV